MILSWHKSDQVFPLLKVLQWLPTQSESWILSYGLPALVQCFSVNTLISSLKILTLTYSVSTELSSLLFVGTPGTFCLCTCYSSSWNDLPWNILRAHSLISFRYLLRCQLSLRPSLTTLFKNATPLHPSLDSPLISLHSTYHLPTYFIIIYLWHLLSVPTL